MTTPLYSLVLMPPSPTSLFDVTCPASEAPGSESLGVLLLVSSQGPLSGTESPFVRKT